MQAQLQTIDPFAIQFTESFGIRWYGLSYLVGFYVAYLVVVWLSKRSLSTVPVAAAGDFIFTAAIGCMIGGRLGYVLFYSPHLLFDFRNSIPFWGVLAINEGGMASHGGIIGIVIACWWFARKHKLLTLHLLDLCALTGPIGIFFGRIANFINGELVGRIAPADAWFQVKFPQDMLMWHQYDPHRLLTLAPVAQLFSIEPSQWQSWVLQSSYRADAKHAVDLLLHKIINAVQAGNTIVAESLTPLIDSRYPSQLFEAFLEGFFLFVLLAFLWRKARPTGFIAAAFFIAYAVVRILGEFYRMPDAHIGYQIFDLTRGQILSFSLIAFGAVLLAMSRHRPTIGGWQTLFNRPGHKLGG